MVLVSSTYWGGMPFWFRKAPADVVADPVILRAHDMRQLRAMYWSSSRVVKPRIGIVIIHPRIDFHHHYTIPRFVDAGYAVLAANTRHAGNDTMAEHEEMVLDVAACVRHLKDKRGVEIVLLLGNCGGGSLVAFYQAQANRTPDQRLARSPGGSPTYFAAATMPAADGVMLTAAHRGQGKVLIDAIDPAVVDERDPLSCDPALDLYNPDNGFVEPPAWSTLSPDFVARYREAQRARVARLDATAHELITRHATAATPREKAVEPIMVVYRTMANPAFIDRSIEASPRDYGSLLSERPDLMNYAALGFARTCTPRAWLSTWSGLSSNADLVANVAGISQPTLVVHAGRDREIYPGDVTAVAGALGATDKRVVTMDDARHYFEPDVGKDNSRVDAMMDIVTSWIHERWPMTTPSGGAESEDGGVRP